MIGLRAPRCPATAEHVHVVHSCAPLCCPCHTATSQVDAIGGRRFSEGTSADREIQRTLMELLSQLDGFDVVGKVGSGIAANHHLPSASARWSKCRDTWQG